MKKEKLYDVVCSKSDPYSETEPYTRTVGTKLPLKEAQQAMLDDALSEIEYNGHIYVGKDGEEFEYIDYDNLQENVTKYLKRHSIGKSMSVTQWNGEEIDYSIVEHKEPANAELLDEFVDEIWDSGITIKSERIAEYIGRTKVAEFYQTTCAKDVEEFISECSTGFSGTPIDGSPFTRDDSDDYAREYWEAHHVED